MTDLICSFCSKPDSLVFARGEALICAGCVESAYEALHGRSYIKPYDRIHGGMLEGVAVAEGLANRAPPRRLRLVHDRKPA